MWTAQELGWALVRMTFGTLLALNHGYGKVLGGKMAGFIGHVAGLGVPAPKIAAWAAGLSELVGGILVAIGFLTRPAAAMAACTMMVAVYSHRHDPLAKMEMALLYLAVMLAAVLKGGGRFSVDSVAFVGGGGGGRRVSVGRRS